MRKCFETTIIFAKRNGLLDSSIAVDELEQELSSPPKNDEEAQVLARKVMDFMNLFEIRFRAKQPLDLQRATLRKTKKEVGAIDDVVRGEILQRMKEHGLSVPATKKLDRPSKPSKSTCSGSKSTGACPRVGRIKSDIRSIIT